MSPEIMGAREKGIGDVVTEADFRSEALVLDALTRAFPDDGLTGEEGADVGATGKRRWYADPLDGTLNYSRGVPVWCISLALVEEGRPVVGVIHDPIRHETFTARRGGGAHLNGREIRCRSDADLGGAFVHMTVDFHEDSRMMGLEDIVAVAPAVLRVRNIGSAALALAYVAAGRFDAMIHRYASPWDYAAGVALIQEAGGVVTAIDGGAYTPETRAVLASANTHVYGEILQLLPKVAGQVE